MASSTHPPSSGGTSDPVSNLYLSDTFYTWFNVSNDLINKVNPIELYSITADQRDYTDIGADGITIDDLGFGNYRIGYILPANITGGHTFHQDINFAAGISGHLVNTVNGRTGAVQAIQTISGFTAEFTGFTGNVPGAVFAINGVTANPTGSMTLDILGQLTGDAGTIAASTGGAGGTYERRVQLFTSAAATLEDQVALRIRGTTKDAGIGIGNLSPDGSYGIQIDSTLLNKVGGSSAGGIYINTDTNDAYNIMTDGQGAFGAGATLYIVSGHANSNASTVFRHAAGAGYTAPASSMTDLFKVDNQGIVLSGKVKEYGGGLGVADEILVSDANSNLTFANIMSAVGDALSQGSTITNAATITPSIGEIRFFQLTEASTSGITVGSSGNIHFVHAVRSQGSGTETEIVLANGYGLKNGQFHMSFTPGADYGHNVGFLIRLK